MKKGKVFCLLKVIFGRRRSCQVIQGKKSLRGERHLVRLYIPSAATCNSQSATDLLAMRTLLIVSLLSSFFLSTMAWPRWRGGCTSDQDCPASHPDCSVEGFCMCANDQPCWDERGGGGSPATTYPASPSPHPPSYNTLEAPSQGYSAPKAPQASPPTDSYQEPSLGHIKQPEEIGYLQPSPPQSLSPTPAAPPAAPPAPTPGPAPSLAGSCKSDQDCPASHPICSEWYFCQCPSYKPGGVGCWDPEADGSE